MRGCSEISIAETIHGDYVATCGSLSAEGATPSEAEQLLLSLLDTRQADGERALGSASIYEDPDARPLDDEPGN